MPHLPLRPSLGLTLRLPVLLVQVCLALACAHTPTPPPQKIALEPLKFAAFRDPSGVHTEAYDATSLFEQANRDLKLSRFAEASSGYERLLAEFPGSRLERPALYNAGLAREGQKDFAAAAARYQDLLTRFPGAPDALDAEFHLGACLAELGRFAESLAVFDRVLLRPRLTTPDRLEALSRRGRALLELGQLEAAERTFRDALGLSARPPSAGEEAPDSDYYASMAQFYLGQVPHRMFRALPLRLPQQKLEDDIEAKARMFLQAQARYIDTIRRQHPSWAPAAGFQIGALYREMYELLLQAPIPPELDSDEKKAVYLDVLRGKLRVLLEKARRIHEKNADMAARLGARTDWAAQSTAQLEELDQLLQQPGAAPAPAPPPPTDADAAPATPGSPAQGSWAPSNGTSRPPRTTR